MREKERTLNVRRNHIINKRNKKKIINFIDIFMLKENLFHIKMCIYTS